LKTLSARRYAEQCQTYHLRFDQIEIRFGIPFLKT
jgi:hypothetical protein